MDVPVLVPSDPGSASTSGAEITVNSTDLWGSSSGPGLMNRLFTNKLCHANSFIMRTRMRYSRWAQVPRSLTKRSFPGSSR